MVVELSFISKCSPSTTSYQQQQHLLRNGPMEKVCRPVVEPGPVVVFYSYRTKMKYSCRSVVAKLFSLRLPYLLSCTQTLITNQPDSSPKTVFAALASSPSHPPPTHPSVHPSTSEKTMQIDGGELSPCVCRLGSCGMQNLQSMNFRGPTAQRQGGN